MSSRTRLRARPLESSATYASPTPAACATSFARSRAEVSFISPARGKIASSYFAYSGGETAAERRRALGRGERPVVDLDERQEAHLDLAAVRPGEAAHLRRPHAAPLALEVDEGRDREDRLLRGGRRARRGQQLRARRPRIHVERKELADQDRGAVLRREAADRRDRSRRFQDAHDQGHERAALRPVPPPRSPAGRTSPAARPRERGGPWRPRTAGHGACRRAGPGRRRFPCRPCRRA